MNPTQRDAMDRVLAEVRIERDRQHEVHGEQDLPNAPYYFGSYELLHANYLARKAQAEGQHGWGDVLAEEVFEALDATSDPADLRSELIQVAAVAVQWVEALDRAAAAKQAGAGATNEAKTGEGMSGEGIGQQGGGGCVHRFHPDWRGCVLCGANRAGRDPILPGYDANGSEVE